VRKLTLQWRLTIMAAIILTLCCGALYLFVANSSIMRLQNLELGTVSIETDAMSFDLDLAGISAPISAALMETQRKFQVESLVVTIIVILTGSTLTWLVSGAILRPLKQLTKQMEEVNDKNLAQQLKLTGANDEISNLTCSCHAMMQRLDEEFRSQEQFTANAAHELRTPLAVLQTNLEVLQKRSDVTQEEYQQAVSTMLKQTDRLCHLVNELLELLGLHNVEKNEQIALAELVEEVFCDLAPVAAQKKVSLSQSGIQCSISGNDVLIYRAVYNLVENAIKYNHDGGWVNVELNQEDKTTKIAVRDSGEGIDPDMWDSIFRPFVRVDKNRSRALGGAGLGLALVSDIAQVHNGTVYVHSSNTDGSTIILEIEKEGTL